MSKVIKDQYGRFYIPGLSHDKQPCCDCGSFNWAGIRCWGDGHPGDNKER